MHQPVGIIGLGRAGLAAARAYLKDGYPVFSYDVDPSVMRVLSNEGGTATKSPAEVSRHVRVIIVLVLNDDQVNEVIAGKDGILDEARPGTTIICMSTVKRGTVEAATRRCREKGADFIDCPFTGGPARIASRSLTLIAAAPPALIDRVRPILEALGVITHAGNDPGQGQAIKHCNQLLVGVTHAATMEVLILARKLGLDPSLVASVIASGIAGSDYFRMLSESVLKKIPSPGGLGQMAKDMSIVENTLREAGMNAQVALAASEYFSAAVQFGMSGRDGADLIDVVEQQTGKSKNPGRN